MIAARELSLAGLCACLTLGLTLIGGCVSNSQGPEMLTINAADYAAAFDAAVDAARDEGLPPALRDRRDGVIETQPLMAGSLLEPWRTDNATLGQATENTIAYQRRRARFEFVPVGFHPTDTAATTQPLSGPDVVNAQQPTVDLTTATGELELRVWVFLERGYIPGLRRSLWTRSKTTQTQLVYPEGMTDPKDSKNSDDPNATKESKDRKGMTINWMPFARDPDYERRLLNMVQESLAKKQRDASSDEEKHAMSDNDMK